MNLRLQYSLRKQGLESLYDIIDRDTGECVSAEPMPWDESQAERKRILQSAPKPNPQDDCWDWLSKAPAP